MDLFENIKHINPKSNVEYWLARELQHILEYMEWHNFIYVIEKAKNACKNSYIMISYDFVDVNKIVKADVTSKPIPDIALTRYACYLIAQNEDSSKEVIAKTQTYFTVQTRQQELTDQFPELPEDDRRLAIRSELIRHNKY